MQGRHLRCISAATVLAGLCVWGAEAQAKDARVEQGERDYRLLCASCHGLEGRGDGPVAPALEPLPSDLTTIAKRRNGVFPGSAISRIIDGRDPVVAHGNRNMPVWGTQFSENAGERAFGYSRGRIQILVEYLKWIQVPKVDTPKN